MYLASIAVAADQRRRGVARELLTYGFRRTGGERVDLLTDTAPAF